MTKKRGEIPVAIQPRIALAMHRVAIPVSMAALVKYQQKRAEFFAARATD